MAMYLQSFELEESTEPEKRRRMKLNPEIGAKYPEDDLGQNRTRSMCHVCDTPRVFLPLSTLISD